MKVQTHRHTGYEDRLAELEKFKREVGHRLRQAEPPTTTVYSADGDVCVGHDHQKWHKIVCAYEGDRCIGSPRPHWMSRWEFHESGFTLSSMVDHQWKGWHGQYSESELRYDELPRDILKLHADTMGNYLKSLSLWFPAHIYNGITGDLYRP